MEINDAARIGVRHYRGRKPGEAYDAFPSPALERRDSRVSIEDFNLLPERVKYVRYKGINEGGSREIDLSGPRIVRRLLRVG